MASHKTNQYAVKLRYNLRLDKSMCCQVNYNNCRQIICFAVALFFIYNLTVGYVLGDYIALPVVIFRSTSGMEMPKWNQGKQGYHLHAALLLSKGGLAIVPVNLLRELPVSIAQSISYASLLPVKNTIVIFFLVWKAICSSKLQDKTSFEAIDMREINVCWTSMFYVCLLTR